MCIVNCVGVLVQSLRACLFQLLLASASQNTEAKTNSSAVELAFEKLKNWVLRK
uniref:Uncharacterized protein n=1 Tax=Arundo donax TaxID=35708 RepID=A0A0A9E9S5_ARUDO